MYAVDDLDDGDKPSNGNFIWCAFKKMHFHVNVKMKHQNKWTNSFVVVANKRAQRMQRKGVCFFPVFCNEKAWSCAYFVKWILV